MTYTPEQLVELADHRDWLYALAFGHLAVTAGLDNEAAWELIGGCPADQAARERSDQLAAASAFLEELPAGSVNALAGAVDYCVSMITTAPFVLADLAADDGDAALTAVSDILLSFETDHYGAEAEQGSAEAWRAADETVCEMIQQPANVRTMFDVDSVGTIFAQRLAVVAWAAAAALAFANGEAP